MCIAFTRRLRQHQLSYPENMLNKYYDSPKNYHITKIKQTQQNCVYIYAIYCWII